MSSYLHSFFGKGNFPYIKDSSRVGGYSVEFELVLLAVERGRVEIK